MAASLTAPGADDAQLRAAHQALMRTRGLQHEFSPAPAQPEPPGWLIKLLQAIGEALQFAAPALKILFWAAVAAAVAWLLWLAVRDLPLAGRFRRRKPVAAAGADDWRPDASSARALLEDVDRLAAAGRYGEAVHLLLFRSIEDIGKRRSAAVRSALTSREIVEAAPLSDAGRAAFRRIADAVERSFFAGRTTDQAEFDACRRCYQDFALAEGAQ